MEMLVKMLWGWPERVRFLLHMQSYKVRIRVVFPIIGQELVTCTHALSSASMRNSHHWADQFPRPQKPKKGTEKGAGSWWCSLSPGQLQTSQLCLGMKIMFQLYDTLPKRHGSGLCNGILLQLSDSHWHIFNTRRRTSIKHLSFPGMPVSFLQGYTFGECHRNQKQMKIESEVGPN